jgi:4-alpha-glucanotransferase
VPPDADYWSPYSGRDAHCGNPLLLSLELLAEDGLLQRSELPPVLPVSDAQFVQVRRAHARLCTCAHSGVLVRTALPPCGCTRRCLTLPP